MQPRLDVEKLEARIAELARAIDAGEPHEPGLARAAAFAVEVATWNARMAVVGSKTSEAGLLEILFADALVLADRRLVPDGARALDVGSGFGAPALPLALLREDVSLVMVEPMQRRCAFLRAMVGRFELMGRVRVVESQVEKLSPLGQLDVALSRATFAPEAWIPMGLELARSCVALTAGEVSSTSARKTLAIAYALPSTGALRLATRWERVSDTT